MDHACQYDLWPEDGFSSIIVIGNVTLQPRERHIVVVIINEIGDVDQEGKLDQEDLLRNLYVVINRGVYIDDSDGLGKWEIFVKLCHYDYQIQPFAMKMLLYLWPYIYS